MRVLRQTFDRHLTLFPPFRVSVKEACIILTLNMGSALLLRDLLRETEEMIGPEEQQPSPEAALNEQGVFRLTPYDVTILLGLRASWPAQWHEWHDTSNTYPEHFAIHPIKGRSTQQTWSESSTYNSRQRAGWNDPFNDDHTFDLW